MALKPFILIFFKIPYLNFPAVKKHNKQKNNFLINIVAICNKNNIKMLGKVNTTELSISLLILEQFISIYIYASSIGGSKTNVVQNLSLHLLHWEIHFTFHKKTGTIKKGNSRYSRSYYTMKEKVFSNILLLSTTSKQLIFVSLCFSKIAIKQHVI